MIYLGNSEKRLKANITTRINDLIEKLNSPNISRETILEMIQCSKELQQFGNSLLIAENQINISLIH